MKGASVIGRVVVAACATVMVASCTPKSTAFRVLMHSERMSLQSQTTRTHALRLPGVAALQVIVTQDKLDVRVALRRNGAVLASSDCPTQRDGFDVLALPALVAGSYELLVEYRAGDRTAGSYAVEARYAPASDIEEERHWRAARAMAQACEVRAKDTLESWRAAEALFLQAAHVWGDLDDVQMKASALFAAGSVEYWKLNNFAVSAENSERALAGFAAVGDARHAARAGFMQASSLVDLAGETHDAEQARELYAKGLQQLDQVIQRQTRLDRQFDLAESYNKQGYAHYYLGAINESSRSFRKALLIFRDLRETEKEAITLQNFALNLHELGEFLTSARAYDSLLTRIDPVSSKSLYATVIQNSSLPYAAMAEIDEVLRRQETAYQLLEQLGDRNGAARSLQAIGAAFQQIVGDPERALRFYEAALLQRTDVSGIEATKIGMGDALRDLSRAAEAVDYHEAVAGSSTSVLRRARARIALAQDLRQLGRTREAEKALQPLVSGVESTVPDSIRALAFVEQGEIRAAHGAEGEGVKLIEEALAIHQRNRSRVNVVDTQYRLARVHRRSGRTADAERTLSVALREVEELRVSATDPELRMSFVAARRGLQEMRVDLLMEVARTRQDRLEGLVASEQLRARSLLDRLSAERLDAQSDVILDAQLAGKAYQYERALQQGERGHAARVALAADIARLELQSAAREAALKQRGGPVNLAEPPQREEVESFIRQLPSDLAVIEFQLGEERSWVWIASAGDIVSLELPSGARIDAAVELVMHQLAGEQTWRAQRNAWQEPAARLSALIRLDALRMVTARRLLLIPDGALSRVPFAALTATPANARFTPLIERFELSYAPSLAAAIRVRTGLAASAEWRGEVAVYANPAFAPGLQSAVARPRLDMSAVELPGLTDAVTLSALPGALHEAEVLKRIVPPGARLVRTGLDASKAQFLADAPGEFRVLHLATHAAVDMRHPRLTFLQLALFDREGASVPGLMRLNEVRTLALRNELVVLSACRTASGRDWRGEGPVGLARAFLEAGAQSVLASLWDVPDTATARLFEHFYSAFLTRGLPASEALQVAQMELAADRRWAHPRYWAAHVIFVHMSRSTATTDGQVYVRHNHWEMKPV